MNLPRFATRLAIAATAGVLCACSAITFGIANAPAAFGPYVRKADLAYGTDKRQKLDVYLPTASATTPALVPFSAPADGEPARASGAAPTAVFNSAAPGSSRPVVIFWYGGSWQSGSKSDYRFVGAALAERGYITVLPDYRLYPDVKFPDFLDDAAHAVAWVQQHAQEFGGDPHRVVLMGHSAGAYTAAYLALNREFLARRGAKPEWIVGLVGLSGPYVLEPNTRTLNRIFAAPWGESDWQPIRFASAQAPPTFLAHGLDDDLVAVAQTVELRDALQSKGVRVETELYRDTGHAATIASFSKPARGRAPTLDQVARFLGTLTSASTARTDPLP
ncbi:MAG: alpha/beta hydrolase [Gammaproteobacteria bacterium]